MIVARYVPKPQTSAPAEQTDQQDISMPDLDGQEDEDEPVGGKEADALVESDNSLVIFDEANWHMLFWVCDEYVSAVVGQRAFDDSVDELTQEVNGVKSTPHYQSLFTISDLVFVLNTLDNSNEAWKQIATYGNGKLKNMKLPQGVEKAMAKYTEGKTKNNSKNLKSAYLALNKKVRAGFAAVNSSGKMMQFNEELFQYLGTRLRDRLKPQDAKEDENPLKRKREKPKPEDLDDEDPWHFVDCVAAV